MLDQKTLELPFEIQVILASGYVAYKIASSGVEDNHKHIDVAFSILIYSVIAKLGYELSLTFLIETNTSPLSIKWLSIAGSFVLPVISAIFWRKWGKNFIVFLLQKAKISSENFRGSTWSSLIHEQFEWSYLSVRLNDGSYIESDLQSLPDELSKTTCELDEAGNIALYITSIIDPDGKEQIYDIENDVLDNHGREHLTFIPTSEIARVSISRYIRKPSTSSSEEAEQG